MCFGVLLYIIRTLFSMVYGLWYMFYNTRFSFHETVPWQIMYSNPMLGNYKYVYYFVSKFSHMRYCTIRCCTYSKFKAVLSIRVHLEKIWTVNFEFSVLVYKNNLKVKESYKNEKIPFFIVRRVFTKTTHCNPDYFW